MKWTKDEKTAGFTLVELIVVIAIMGILAGIGTAGYGGYVKYANKGADKQLVGNIVRAIETGTNSMMFVSDDSFTKGATTYPVGIIELTETGCTVKASDSTISSTDTACNMVTITNYVPVGGYTVSTKSGLLSSVDYYTVTTTESITYCETHSNALVSNVPTSYKTTWGVVSGDNYKDYVFAEHSKGVYELKTDHVQDAVISSENIVANSTDRVVTSTTSPIYESLAAAFGDLDSLSLSYSGWGDAEDEGHTYATLLTYTDTLIGDIESLASTLLTFEAVASDYLSDEYEDAADMMDSFANYFGSKYQDYGDWEPIWNAAADGTDANTFGLSGNDYIYAARVSYNTAFASYCDANGIEDKYIEVIKDYHHNKNVVIGNIPIPDCVNTTAFDSTDADDADTLYAQFAAKGDDGTNFAKCKDLFKIYKDSEACKQNGETFYTTMQTVAATGSEAYKYGTGGEDGYFDYYENLMKEMAAYYDFIEDYNGSGVIILVSVDEGEVICQVSPAAADPRNED